MFTVKNTLAFAISTALIGCGGGSSSSSDQVAYPNWKEVEQGITYDSVSQGKDFVLEYAGNKIYAVANYDGSRGVHNYNLFSYRVGDNGAHHIGFYGVIVRSESGDYDHLYTFNAQGIQSAGALEWFDDLNSDNFKAYHYGNEYIMKPIDDLPRIDREMPIASGHLIINDPTRTKEYVGNCMNGVNLTRTDYEDYSLAVELRNGSYTFDYNLDASTYGRSDIGITETTDGANTTIHGSIYAETVALFDHESIVTFDVAHDFNTDQITYFVSVFSENLGLNRDSDSVLEFKDITVI